MASSWEAPLAEKMDSLMPPSLLAAQQYQDKKLGFKIATPKKWTQIPIKNDERWIVARFQSNKAEHFNDKTFGFTFEHKPELTLISFTGESVKTDIELDLKDPDGKDTGTISGTLLLENPYQDYEEYLRKTYDGGGWFIDEEVEKKIRDIAVTVYEIKVEKSSYGGPKHITTWVFHLVGVDVAVQFECLENAFPKLKREFEAKLKTFQLIEATEEQTDVSSGFREFINNADNPEERKNLRLTIEKEQHEKALANLPEDWTSDDQKEFLVLSHVDKKHTKEIVDQISNMFHWLNENFDYVGSEEYVRRPIVRICASSEEMMLFQSGGGWSFTNIEILTCQDTDGFSNWFMGSINERAFSFWFDERDRELYNRLPFWLHNGVDGMLRAGEAKGSRMQFEAAQREKASLRDALRDGTLTMPSKMLLLTTEEMGENRSIYSEFSAFTRYLLVGKGAKDKLSSGLMHEYLSNLKQILVEEEAIRAADADLAGEDDGPETEEEEDEAFKAKQNGWKERADAIAKEVFERTFDDWTQSDWDALDKAYLNSIK